jgi:Na+/H+-dicarboxylate symporter/ABC-type amino acid transport substrate-binding protein
LISGNRHFSLGYQVLAAVVLGVFVGLFFGPLTTVLKPVGDIFVMLLQMVVLPYICFSLIHGLGSISPMMGKKLFRSGWPFLLVIWLLTFFIIFLLGHLIPKPLVAFIGSDSQEPSSILSKNFLSYLVPENPFYDLANNIVPAVAIFGLIVGGALMHLEQKEPLLSILERVNQTIEKILKWLAILSPIGAFAHISVAFGTVRFEDLYKLEFYVVCFILVSLFVTFWILPTLISNLTPLTYRDVLKGFKTVCLLPFVTGLPTIALPFINYYMRKLGQEKESGEKAFHSTSQTVMPIAYSFGQIGNSMILFFILFLSFYYRHPFVGSEKALLSILTLPLSLGSAATSVNAVSFLINQLNFPVESIELYTETLSITLNFQVLMSVASILTLIILTLYAYYGLLEIKWRPLCIRLGSSLLIFTALVLGAKSILQLDDNYQSLYGKLKLSDVISNPVTATILKAGEKGAPREAGGEPLSQILSSGILKVGYDPRNIPYCYLNDDKELVGYDVAYAYQLARDLDCKIEFVPIDLAKLGPDLNTGTYDIAMAAILMNEERLVSMDFTHPYTEQDNVLVVPLHEKNGFVNLQKAVEQPGLKIGAIGGYAPLIARHFPLATYIPSIDIDPQLTTGEVNAWVWSRIPAFIWCLSHPEYVVIDYQGLIGKRYFSYPIQNGAVDFASFLNNWLSLKEQSGFKAQMTRHWIEGDSAKAKEPRWSILRNIFHVGHH